MTPCEIWDGRIDRNGYGKLGNKWAHRVAWEVDRGPIPPGMWIDHLCRVRACVNVEHMEVVTPKVNLGRATTYPDMQIARSSCRNGHTYSPNNVRMRNGNRQCIICARARWHRWKARHAA